MAKDDDIKSIEKGIKILKDTYDALKAKLNLTPLGEQGPLVEEMAAINKKIGSNETYLNHLKAADTEVSPPTAASYKALDKALEELENLKKSTDTVIKIIEISTAIAKYVKTNRDEVAGRETG